ncbi:hypothetical protein [Saccharothrix deserti]|uniref:hypothetical protein n=1 Tax=Saccharothrix deserti TaxID=2593674 RepID=UPI001EE41428|nr:hypothetical protein [Saccharothrix deserti]
MTTRQFLDRAALPAVCAVMALVVLAPVLGPGFVLAYDMVFAPRHSLLPDGLGLGTTPARSVPADAVIAAATLLAPGDLVQKLLLAAALVLGPLGAGRLVPTTSTGTRLVAATAYGWTPFVAERLFMGHWPYLLAYACLPWVAAAGFAHRRGEPKSLARLVLWSVPAVLTPTGGLLAAGTALATSGRLRVLPALVLLNAPWWVPSVLRPALSTPDAVGWFDARAENWGGVVVSVLGTGGFWNADVTPASRGLPLTPVLTLAVVAVAAVGWPTLVRRIPRAQGLLALGGVGLVFALAAHLPFGATALQWLVSTVPGTALLRDAQKWVAWWALPLALGFALAVERARPALAVAVLLPVLAMPDLAWGGWGRLAAVQYPADWSTVREILANDDRPGDVLALPLGAFRRFGWNDDRTQLDPAPRFLPRTTVIDDTVYVDGNAVPGEDTRLPAIREALRRNGDLGALGIGWVLVEHGTPGRIDAGTTDSLTEVHRGTWLSLYRVPGPVSANHLGPPRAPVVAADVAALLFVAGCLLWQALPAGRLIGHRRHEE